MTPSLSLLMGGVLFLATYRFFDVPGVLVLGSVLMAVELWVDLRGYDGRWV